MDKFTIGGVKKLRGLTRTKIRLAKEAGTVYTKPKPLQLVKLLSGCEIETIEQAERYLDNISFDFDNPKEVAKIVLMLTDIIEGVKYEFEPKESMSAIDRRKFKENESKSRDTSSRINLLLMTKNIPRGVNLFVGENPPKDAVFLGSVPTCIAPLLNFAFNSEYFSEGSELKNIDVILGHRTLILTAICSALGEFKARVYATE